MNEFVAADFEDSEAGGLVFFCLAIFSRMRS